MKKHGLVKVISLLLLVVVVLTYFVSGRDGNVQYLAICDVVTNFVQSFYYFFDTFVFLLVIGGFYAILNKTKGYRKLIDSIVNKFSDKRKIFVIVVTIIFALVSSLTGLNLILYVFIPFVISIILLMEYDKLIAVSATVGAVLVGFIGGIFTTVRTQAGYSTFESLVGLNKAWANVIPRIILLVVATGLLIFNILQYIKRYDNGEGEELSDTDLLLIQTKDKSGKVVSDKYEGVRSWPLIVVFAVLFVLFVLGFMPWSGLFKVNVFTKFHTWLSGLKIGNFAVYTSLISSTFPPFGEWAAVGNYLLPIFFLGLFALIIKFVYKIKFNSAIDAFAMGAKKMLPAAGVAILAYAVLVCSYNNGFIETIITNASKSNSVVLNSLVTVLGSILNVDLYYTTNGVFSVIVQNLSESANLKVYALAFQSIFGLVNLIAPTSILLVVTLTYLDIPYTKWLKYIWRFILELIIVVFVTMMIITVM